MSRASHSCVLFAYCPLFPYILIFPIQMLFTSSDHCKCCFLCPSFPNHGSQKSSLPLHLSFTIHHCNLLEGNLGAWSQFTWSKTGNTLQKVKQRLRPTSYKPEKTSRRSQCILLSERSQCMLPTTWHSEKCKTMLMVKRSVIARRWREEGKSR